MEPTRPLWRWAVHPPLFLIGLGAAAAGTYLDVLAFAAFFDVPRPRRAADSSRLAVLVPAHNEADFVARCVASLERQDYLRGRYRIVVIADNCTDETASIAESAGAEVLIRSDPRAVGKGHALRWAIDRVLAAADPPDAIVVVDADSVADQGFLGALAARLESGAEVVQCQYLALKTSDSAAAELRAATLVLFHRVRFSGRAVLGMPCNLVGNGMLFSRRVLTDFPWNAFSSTEDLEYSIDLRLAGIEPVYAPEAGVWAPLPEGGRAAKTQRMRWEGGRFNVVKTHLPKLLREVLVGRRWSLADAALDLAVPPLGLLATVAAGGTAASMWLAATGRAPRWLVVPWAAAAASIPVFVLGGLAAADAPIETYRALVHAPRYVASTTVSRLRLLRGLGATTWERTERPSDISHAADTRNRRHSNNGKGWSRT